VGLYTIKSIVERDFPFFEIGQDLISGGLNIQPAL